MMQIHVEIVQLIHNQMPCVPPHENYYQQPYYLVWYAVIVLLHLCVCACPPVMRGDTVKHALTSTSSPPNEVPSIRWSPVVLLPLWTPWGAVLERFPTDLCILNVGLRGSCCWATPQPKNLSLWVANTRTLYTGTAQRQRAELKLGIGAIVVTCQYSARCYSAVQSGNQVPILYREMRKPHSSCTKVRLRISY